jgi:hypothetical protein
LTLGPADVGRHSILSCRPPTRWSLENWQTSVCWIYTPGLVAARYSRFARASRGTDVEVFGDARMSPGVALDSLEQRTRACRDAPQLDMKIRS